MSEQATETIETIRLRDAASGAVAGLAATAPMTALLYAGYSLLPAEEQYPLPPAEITSRVFGLTPIGPLADTETRGLATCAGHFGYGAFTGALYGALLGAAARRSPAAAVLTGAAWGSAIWAASYLGWIPAARLLSPATQHPPARNALMIAANLLQGAVTALLLPHILPAPDRRSG